MAGPLPLRRSEVSSAWLQGTWLEVQVLLVKVRQVVVDGDNGLGLWLCDIQVGQRQKCLSQPVHIVPAWDVTGVQNIFAALSLLNSEW